MANTSATGGYLKQTSGSSEGLTLQRFLQEMIVAVTGLPPIVTAGDSVRPLWQPNPPPLPDISKDWCAFGIVSIAPDENSFIKPAADGLSSQLIRHETFDLRCSFYGASCIDYANRLHDGLELAQNREVIFIAGMGIVGFSNVTHVPDLVNDRFYNRADMTMTIKREVKKTYEVLSFLGASGTISTGTIAENYSV